MTEKRFNTNGYKIYDNFHDGIEWLLNNVDADEIVKVMNNLDIKARERSKALSKLQKENEQLKSDLDYFWKAYSNQEYGLDCETHIQLSSPIPSRKELLDENEQLKSEIKDLNDVLARYEEKELN